MGALSPFRRRARSNRGGAERAATPRVQRKERAFAAAPIVSASATRPPGANVSQLSHADIGTTAGAPMAAPRTPTWRSREPTSRAPASPLLPRPLSAHPRAHAWLPRARTWYRNPTRATAPPASDQTRPAQPDPARTRAGVSCGRSHALPNLQSASGRNPTTPVEVHLLACDPPGSVSASQSSDEHSQW